jgi:hypothetical protein
MMTDETERDYRSFGWEILADSDVSGFDNWPCEPDTARRNPPILILPSQHEDLRRNPCKISVELNLYDQKEQD